MKYLIILIPLIALSKSPIASFENVQYLSNYDGDTVTVNIKSVHPLLGERIPIRVNGIDTPEIKGKTECEKKKAIEARDFVRNELKNAKKINLRDSQREKYFRLLSHVEYDGKNLADELIKRKLAVPYDGGTKKGIKWCDL